MAIYWLSSQNTTMQSLWWVNELGGDNFLKVFLFTSRYRFALLKAIVLVTMQSVDSLWWVNEVGGESHHNGVRGWRLHVHALYTNSFE